MRFGVCAPVTDAKSLAAMGFEYIEVNATSLTELPESEFTVFLRENHDAPIHAETANCLFPGDIRLTGDGVDMEVIEKYVSRAMARLERAGIHVVVFGSGGSRRVPEGFSREEAFAQLVKVGRLLAKYAELHGVTVALEPLRCAETNMINTQAEGIALVKAVDRPAFQLLCDYYHLIEVGGTMRDVLDCAGLLVHTHIANPVGRAAMAKSDEADYAAFFDALRAIGYDGRMSVECNSKDLENLFPEALSVMQNS